MAVVALATLMGVHAFRGFVAMVVWNVGADRSAPVLGGIAFAVFAVGLAGWAAAARWGARQAGIRRAAIFAIVYALSHVVRHPALTPVLALAAAVAWLWVLPALVGRLARSGTSDVLAAGFLTGFAWTVALQTALHGLDLAVLRGLLPGAGASALAVILVAAWHRMPSPAAGPGGAGNAQEASGLPGWGLIAFGPYLMLQLTLLANLGRVQVLTDAVLPGASVVILAGLTAGALIAALPLSGAVRTIAAVLSVAAVVPDWVSRQGIVLLPVAQIALAVTLAASLAPRGDRRPGPTYAAGAGGLLVAFVLLFFYYSRYEVPALWPVLAALVAAPALLRRLPRPQGTRGLGSAAAATVVVAGMLGWAAGSLPPRSAAQPGPPTVELRVLDYNIHMGFDAFGVPDPYGIARVIEEADADVIALQEVGRGWTVNGGADLFAWLRWRFPAYRAVYGPINGDLWGNALLSRRPLTAHGSQRFPLRESPFQRGLTWASLPTPAGDVLVIATHFAHEETAESDRLEQAGDVLAFWRSRPRTILMGDFNAEPDSAPVTRLQASGLRDALTPSGLDAAPTYPSPAPSRRIDYVLVSDDVEPVAGTIPHTTASDHLPLVVQIRLR